MCVFSWGKRCGQEQAREESEGTGGETTCGGVDRAGAGGDERLRFSELPAKGKSNPEGTNSHTLAISGRWHSVSEDFLRRLCEVFSWSPLFNRTLRFFFSKRLTQLKLRNKMKMSWFPYLVLLRSLAPVLRNIFQFSKGRMLVSLQIIWQAWQKKKCLESLPFAVLYHQRSKKYINGSENTLLGTIVLIFMRSHDGSNQPLICEWSWSLQTRACRCSHTFTQSIEGQSTSVGLHWM